MEKDRMLEIASTISRLEGPLVVLGYFTSLDSEDMEIFFNNFKKSEFGNLNFYDGIKLYSANYVSKNDRLENNEFFEEFGYNPDKVDYGNIDYGFKDIFADVFCLNDDENVRVGRGR